MHPELFPCMPRPRGKVLVGAPRRRAKQKGGGDCSPPPRYRPKRTKN